MNWKWNILVASITAIMILFVCQTVIEHMMKILKIVLVNLDVLVVVHVRITMVVPSLPQRPHQQPQLRRPQRYQFLLMKSSTRQF